MKQKQFENENTLLWTEIEQILIGTSDQAQLLPAYYRRLCQNLAMSSQRGYSPALTDYLQKLVTDCHKKLYGAVVERPITLHHWMLQEFPRLVRAEWRLLLLAFIAFFGTGLAVGLLVWFKPDWAYSFASPYQLEEFQHIYQPGNIHMGRGEQGDISMFGVYIWNNVSIGFRTFAGGLFAGVPALISIVFNGIQLGVVGSWLSQDPNTRHSFWSFVITHSSFEVTGLLLSGLAGMRLGLALIWPGRLSRSHSLYAESQRLFPVIIGAALLTVVAAFFEAFWSASTGISYQVKYTVGGICWLSVFSFFIFAGRSKR